MIGWHIQTNTHTPTIDTRRCEVTYECMYNVCLLVLCTQQVLVMEDVCTLHSHCLTRRVSLLLIDMTIPGTVICWLWLVEIPNIINMLLIDVGNLNTLCKYDHILCWRALAQLWRVTVTMKTCKKRPGIWNNFINTHL